MFISSHSGLGGSERYLRLLVGSLGPSWVRGVVCLGEGPLVEALRSSGVAVDVVPAGRRMLSLARSAAGIRSIVRRERPEVVHANGVKAAVAAALALVGTGVPLLWVKHDFARDGWLARLVGRRCAQIVGVCRAVTGIFGDGMRDRVHVVYNGLDELSFSPERGKHELAAALGCPPGAPVVGLVGRLDPGKGHEELLAGVPALVKCVPGLRVAFIGGEDPSQLDFARGLREQVLSSGLESVVGFLGHRDDAIDLIAACRVLAMPSVEVGGFGREAFPYVALEAMAVGTPVACYESGGIPEAFGDCAAYAPYRDRAALEGALLELLVDPDRREELADCGRERVKRFTLSRLSDAMREHYRAATATSAGA
jgi:glycosyltransferase involved in cell wall biosynthesis